MGHPRNRAAVGIPSWVGKIQEGDCLEVTEDVTFEHSLVNYPLSLGDIVVVAGCPTVTFVPCLTRSGVLPLSKWTVSRFTRPCI